MSSFDDFLVHATHTAWLLLRFWAIFLLLPAALLFIGCELLLPGGVLILVRGWFDRLRSSVSPLIEFRDRITAARLQILDRISTRLLLERRHRALPRKLEEFSTRVNAALRNSGFLSDSDDAVQRTSTLLLGFKEDVAAIQKLPHIPSDTVELTVELRAAMFIAWPLTVFGLLLAVVNAGLLYMYWDSWDIGVAAYFAAGFFPLIEIASGVVLKAINNSASRTLGTLMAAVIAIGVVVILAGWEYQIFLTFFEENFRGTDIASRYPWLPTLMPLVGIALTSACSLIGYYAGKYWLEVVRVGTVVNLKKQVDRANAFIAGLPNRLKEMTRDTNLATASLESMAGALEERSKVESTIATELEHQRLAFVQAVAKVDPMQWQMDHPGDQEDRHDVARWAWLMGPIAVAAAIAYLFVFSALLGSGRLLPPAFVWVAWPLAVVSVVIAFVSGSLAFDRLEIAAFGDGKGQVVIYPRDTVLRWFALAGMGALALTILLVSMLGSGTPGILVGLILCLCLVVFMFAGHFNEQFSRGLSFILISLAWAVVLLMSSLWMLARWTAVSLAALVLVVGKGALFVFGCPLTLAFKLWQAREQPPALARAEARTAA